MSRPSIKPAITEKLDADTSISSVQRVDWQAWLRRWEAQQSGLIPLREIRFAAMLDVLETLLPSDFVALDLCCGPGSLSQRLLQRFPQARAVAVDLDPFLLAIGQGALGTVDGRLCWVEVDLRTPEWMDGLGETQFDAVLSTTALHWLPTPDLMQLYHQLGQVVRPGGLVLNGDHMNFASHLPQFQQCADAIRARHKREAALVVGAEQWQEWWDAARQTAAVQNLVAERDLRFTWRAPDNWCNPIYDLHEAALREAGFREVGTIWQYFGNRILMAVR